MRVRQTNTTDKPREYGAESWEYRLVLGVSFLACLLVAASRRCIWRFRRAPADISREDRSVLREAKSMANTFAPFAFMG